MTVSMKISTGLRVSPEGRGGNQEVDGHQLGYGYRSWDEAEDGNLLLPESKITHVLKNVVIAHRLQPKRNRYVINNNCSQRVMTKMVSMLMAKKRGQLTREKRVVMFWELSMARWYIPQPRNFWRRAVTRIYLYLYLSISGGEL